jgi:hypothetical protein
MNTLENRKRKNDFEITLALRGVQVNIHYWVDNGSKWGSEAYVEEIISIGSLLKECVRSN